MMNKIKIVADNKIPFLKGVLEPFANIEYYPGKEITKDKISDADALITRTRTKCDEILLKNSSIKLITTATIGYDHIDVEYCSSNGIKWLNAPGCNSTSVMQYVTSALFFLARKEKFDLKNKIFGVVGVGNVGGKVSKIAENFGMKVLLNDPPRQRTEKNDQFVHINEILERADIIAFHVPLNRDGLDKTFHFADEYFFAKLKKKPILINTSRGEVIKTEALKKGIKRGSVSNVVLDVWENEPNIDLELLEMIDIGTPHIAGYSADGKANGTSVCVNAVNKFFNLGLKAEWYPENIPNAKHGNTISIDCQNKSEQQNLDDLFKVVYDIEKDDKKLRESPDTFEQQRGEYPIRREYRNYNILLANCNPEFSGKLKRIGFKLSI